MRILTWNINGIRTIPQYHPWNTLKSHDEILDRLEADIICFQEMKSSRLALPKSVALPPSYHSFFSFPTKRSGYSGVATYTRIKTVVPVKAEEGLTGYIQPKPPFSPVERVSAFDKYPPQQLDDDELDFKHLDSEGRAITVDFGLFVLINVYCPNDGTGTEERDKYKMDYHRLLEARVRGLIEEGRDVIVLGDINACAAVIDHCEGNIIVARGKAAGLEGEDGFWATGYRGQLRNWLQREDGTGGPMVDVVRRFWPDRKGMYTCWNTKISARDTNYGTRIDYILITPGLLPWIKAADVQQHVKGSDHCPVFIDLHDQIIMHDSSVVKLVDVVGVKGKLEGPNEPPRLAAKFWEEHSGKQTLLDNFFGKNKKTSEGVVSVSPTPQPSDKIDQHEGTSNSQSCISEGTLSPEGVRVSAPDSPTTTSSPTTVQSPSITNSQMFKRQLALHDQPIQSTPKRQKLSEKKTNKKTKGGTGQSKLSSFFIKPATSQTSPASSFKEKKGEKSNQPQSLTDVIDDGDECLTLMQEFADSSQGSTSELNGEAKQAWNSLLAPVHPPNCAIHGEPTKEFTVSKQGPNKGKKFFLCSRPVGPGWDKGKAERLREEVNPMYRCNFFQWSSEWRKQAKKTMSASVGARDSDSQPP
ncbi:DNase I-like protein [Macrolepiota fuliginosa MF-IS2]|uniref:DNA-(apurinic or apyrimidinic site) endonuclease n=1 Tax=Macrolepiota fuliginosa MF-IS2 TaxID=1400762 RepID=A0A9P5X3E1_9AGAR|nr:DNase I-like protein [Macrolepiota fuliginosa MF-IS2]